MVRGRLDHSTHKMTVFNSQNNKEHHQKADFGLFRSLMGGHPKGQRNAGRLDILQEGNVKCTETGHPHEVKRQAVKEDWLD